MVTGPTGLRRRDASPGMTEGSGRTGGDGGGWVERVDRRLADEEAENLAERVPAHVEPIPVGVGLAVLLLGKCLAAAGLLARPAACRSEIALRASAFAV
jgi:hypothetical protein